MIRVQSAGYSDIGKVRKANEDSFLINESIGLFVVADGMGGHRGGAVASRLATKTMGTCMEATCSPALKPDTSKAEDSRAEDINHLLKGIHLANKKIYTLSVKDESCRGMGTTVSALFLSDNFIITANVGDSPIYLLRNGEIETLYTPHTLLHERKKIPKSMEGRFSPSKMAHILTRAVGIHQHLRIDHVKTPCFKDDIIVLCSDGLSGKVTKEEVGALVVKSDAETACKNLTDLAIERGGEDNVTVIVVKILSEGVKPTKGLLGRLLALPIWIGSCLGGKRST